MENENIDTPINTETTSAAAEAPADKPAETAETPAILPDQPVPTPEPIPAPPSSPIIESAPSPIKNLLLKAKEIIQFRKRKKLEKILELAGQKGKITNNDVQKLLRVSDATATRYLSQLVKEGRLKRVGPANNAFYQVAGWFADHLTRGRGSNGGNEPLRKKIERENNGGAPASHFATYFAKAMKVKKATRDKLLARPEVQMPRIWLRGKKFGGGGKAKSCLVINEPAKKSCTGDVFSIRLKNINPIYLYVLLKSKIGKDQILKMKNGVSTENLNTKEALAIKAGEVEFIDGTKVNTKDLDYKLIKPLIWW